MSNGVEARESTLQAVHSDQLQLQDQLRDLSDILRRIEQHLTGGPQIGIGAAAAQAEATLGPGAIMPIQGERPPVPGMLPQMCELGMNNSSAVGDIANRLQHVSRLLGVHDG